MELAGQWRREWAGTAEYGKVTEGGVTRRVARAMEVLNASAPGARVRVMRAAYHSSSGPGVPASSYMLHSSRRVISSGFNLLESPTYPTKPLEISSTPLESSPDSNIETEKYEVTEPDDIEISEPSKWRSATKGSSLRMPSEESSSTDNASIIDLDSKLSHKVLCRKYSYDSENSDINSFKRNSSRASPLLDTPVALSTLKYKSLLNGSNDWNNRRKSYSFEDTSPLNEIILQSNDTLAMESSTDSGICKSSEIVNDYTEDTRRRERDVQQNHERYESTDKSFNEWRNPKNRFYKSSKFQPSNEHNIVIEEPRENNIALQSRGKVSINVPITLEDDDYHLNNNQTSDDNYRKVKRVGFCKTEFHFAAESGKVNIISTDEKPPPTNDFRKRRSAFVPISDKFEKPITLFGEKSDFPESSKIDDFGIKSFQESEEFDENTAATKSILKNKIPKPKPYLLGENMGFGDFSNKEPSDERSVQTGVSINNKQLQTKRIDKTEDSFYSSNTMTDKSFINSLRTTNKGPIKVQTPDTAEIKHDNDHTQTEQLPKSVRHKFNVLQMSPVQKAKTRQLRENELTYFGVDNSIKKVTTNNTTSTGSFHSLKSQANYGDDTFESVRLIKQISNSAQNSEAESDDSPDYQNVPMKNNFAPIPTPRSRVKYKYPNEEVVILRPIIERANETTTVAQESRRSRSKRQEADQVPPSRSLSEPAKKHSETAIQRQDELRHSSSRKGTSHRYKDQKTEDDTSQNNTKSTRRCHRTSMEPEDETSLYANVRIREDKKYKREQNPTDSSCKTCKPINSLEKKKEQILRRSDVDSLKKREGSVKVNSRVQRTEKLSTPEYTPHRNKDSNVAKKTRKESKSTIEDNNHGTSSFVRNKSAVRPSIEIENNELVKEIKLSKVKPEHEGSLNHKSIKPSKNTSSRKKESRNNTEPIIIEHAIKSKDLKAIEKVGMDKDSGSNGRKASRKSEYVIKYDDKNGTVSSISKVRADHGTSRKKHSSKERNKEIKAKDKIVEKSALLQLPEHHRLVKGRKEHSIRKTKSDLQRTCEIL